MRYNQSFYNNNSYLLLCRIKWVYKVTPSSLVLLFMTIITGYATLHYILNDLGFQKHKRIQRESETFVFIVLFENHKDIEIGKRQLKNWATVKQHTALISLSGYVSLGVSNNM